jgi:hypothetical protein
MRLEILPILLGILAAIAGLALVFDAVLRDGVFIAPERRRRARAPRHHLGEGLFGAGLCVIALALVSGDVWRYTTVAMLAALILCAAGTVLNWRYFRGMMIHTESNAAIPAAAPPTAAPPAAAPPAAPAPSAEVAPPATVAATAERRRTPRPR